MSRSIETLFWDCETYVNYFLIQFLHATTGKVVAFEKYESVDLDRETLALIFRNYRLVGFRSKNYDIVVTTAAMQGYSNAQIKAVSDEIILKERKPWQFENLMLPEDIDHIDLQEPAFGVMTSLKVYGGRCHSRKLQDLPIDPSATIDAAQRAQLREYCVNDLETTRDLFNALKADLELRERMSAKYGIDLRSKSDAQMGETIIKQYVQKAMGQKVYPTEIRPGTTFRYVPPPFVQFSSPACQEALQAVRDAVFMIKPNGQPWVPAWGEEVDGLVRGAPVVLIGDGRFRMGYGGLHSSEECVTYYSDAQHSIEDDDVASYYPKIIEHLRLAPRNMGAAFVQVFSNVLAERLQAKLAGDKDTAQTLKIASNGGGFGKTGSRWSAFYAPDMMINVTLTGQLCLLMIIEAFHRWGIPVISANTDGVVTRCPRDKLELKARILKRWSEITSFETETTKYKAYFARDVNAYLALKESGGFKGKGPFNDGTTVEARLAKNPTNVICIDAVRAFLEHGTPIAHTIYSCKDVRKFVTVRTVKGGGTWNGQYLGKVVRWVYAKGGAPILYATNGNKVARTDGCVPLMTLPDALPEGLDHAWYCKEALKILGEIGYE